MVSRELLKHHQKCADQQCEVCTPVKNYVQKQRQMQLRQQDQLRQRQALNMGGYTAGARPAYSQEQLQAMQVGWGVA